MPRPVTPDTLERLKLVVGPAGFSVDPDEMAPLLVEWRNRFVGKTPLLLKPANVREVADIVRVCAAAEVGIVPQGGNTGLVGGQIPRPEGCDLLLSLGRMNRVRRVDPVDNTMLVEAGCTLAAAQEAAAAVDRLLPLSLAAEGSSQVGGNLSTNAGGIHVLRYGNARDAVLGIEVVTADGEIWDGLRALRKDNTGVDLKHLFIGAEGTLGIITAAVLKLFPRPREVQTLFAAVPDAERVLALLSLARDHAGDGIYAFEMISRFALELVTRHTPQTSDPLAAPSPWYVLADVTVPRAAAEALLAAAFEREIITDAVLAGSPVQARALWKLRESASEAQKHEGGSIKHDISVPVSRIPAFLAEALAAAERLIPGIRPVPFGHVGDGNLHFNFTQPLGMDKDAYLAKWEALNRVVHDIVVAHGGSISAEHGIGVLKREEARRYKSQVELELMARIKRALDPKGIMNPGKGVV
ncbi:MAG: FAD-binding oxidoreductase [Deltaproteobacteria bacterium]|nr:FAD-binding oxidoreductase [Deltaproteobacteria bacterium]